MGLLDDPWGWFSGGVNWFATVVLFWIFVAAAILIVGYIVAKISRTIARKVLWRARVDHQMERAGLGQPLRSLGFRGVSDFLSALVFWFIFLMFVLLALTVMPAPQPLADVVGDVVAFIPALIGAAIIIILGVWAATWLSDRVRATATVSELPFPPEAASAAVKYVVIFITAVMALNLMSFDTTILTWTFILGIGALFLALAISFGWGMRHVSANMSGFLQSSRFFAPKDRVDVMGHKGTVREVNRFAVVLEGEDGQEVVIPHSRITQEVVSRAPAEGSEGDIAY